MRNLNIILKEIMELSEIKSAYNHYLSSHRSLTEVENATQLQYNSKIIVQSLNTLRNELLEAKTKQKTIIIKQLTSKTIIHSDDEKKAIFHFNRDRRFTITE